MTNIVLLVKDRPRLTEQTLRTLYMYTDRAAFNLTVIDDGSWPETQQILARYRGYSNLEVVTFLHSVGIVGFLRNVGVWASERFFGRGDYLYLSDNDVAFMPRWLDVMTDRLDFVHGLNVHVLGGYRHPFHGLREGGEGALTTALHEEEGVDLTDAVAGYSHLMKWSTWDDFGPYDQHAKGVCQSEDFAFCQKIRDYRGYVGYVNPPVIAVCGETNSEGKSAIGSESIPRVIGLTYE